MPSNSASNENEADDGFDTVEFGIHDDIIPGESGQGYVLRLASENGLRGLPTVKRLLKKTRFAVLDCQDAEKLAAWFGADPRDLALQLGELATGRETHYSYFGHVLSRSYFLNRSMPRICPACLRESRYCRAAWDMHLMTSCDRHGFMLVEKCPSCLAQLTWNRPHLLQCACGQPLGEIDPSLEISDVHSEIAVWITTKFQRANAQEPTPRPKSARSPTSLLGRLLAPMSLDGGLQLVCALAAAGTGMHTESVEASRKKLGLPNARQTVGVAQAMLQSLLQAGGPPIALRRNTVAIGLLTGAIEVSLNSADRSMAMSILTTLLRQGGKTRSSGAHPQLAQMSLFDDLG